MPKLKKTTRGWLSPTRYIQGPGEFDNLPHFVSKFGKNVAAFIDRFLFDEYSERLNKLFEGKGEVHSFPFEKEVTYEIIDKRTEDVKAASPDVILGIGGGKTIDVAKAVAYKSSLPFIIIPTIAATDAPTSSLSVIYTEQGAHAGEFFYDSSPNLLIVDSQIIANAPTRFLVSGMGDALATLLEADALDASRSANMCYWNDGGYRRTNAGYAIAKLCYESLLKYGVLAKAACDNNIVTEDLENIIETNILLSGLGFENNGTAGAHSVNDGITALPEGAKTFHGEKVAFGCIVQLIAENAPKEKLKEVLDFSISVGLPVCLEDLYVPNTPENINTIAEASMHSNWIHEPFEVTVDMVRSAITAADYIGSKYKAGEISL